MPSISDEDLSAAVALRAAHPSLLAASRAAGLPENTFRNRLLRATARGLDGNIKGVTPPGQIVRETSTLYDTEGTEILQWVKRERERQAVDIAAVMTDAFADWKPFAAPQKAPDAVETELATLLALADLHLGMYAWEGDGGDNWDLKLGEDIIGGTVDRVVAGSPASGLGICLFGGDYFHADNKDNKTARSGHALDVDGRYDKVIEAGTRLAVRIVDRNLWRHQRVLVRVLKGNHDEHAAVALAWFLKAWYRNEPRVTVDTDASLFWYYQFSDVMLGATHGHECKITELPHVMAVRRAQMWGATKFRFAHGFHLHHKKLYGDELGGCIAEVHQTPIPQDSWHFGKGFLSGRSLQSITYHAESGEFGRTRRTVMDNVILPRTLH